MIARLGRRDAKGRDMKASLQFIAWATVMATILVAAASPARGVIFHGPLAVLGLGLIGAGLCIDARKRLASRQPAPEAPTTPRPGEQTA